MHRRRRNNNNYSRAEKGWLGQTGVKEEKKEKVEA
jgi:hypothetical protein